MNSIETITATIDNFSFDDDANRISTKTPSIKVINDLGKLWIAHENCEGAEWRKECMDDCEPNCSNHYVGLESHNIDTKKRDDSRAKIFIHGATITKPRIIVVQRSPLLKIDNLTNRVAGRWVKGDGEEMITTGGEIKRKYVCVRRFMLMFVDGSNQPLHDKLIQLTAKGYFQVEFDKQYMSFRKDMTTVYAKANGKTYSNMTEQWFAHCIFAPEFVVESRGPSAAKQSDACITSGYERPTYDPKTKTTNWYNLCVGNNPKVNEVLSNVKVLCIFICNHYKATIDWWQKAQVKKSPTKEEDDVEECTIDVQDINSFA